MSSAPQTGSATDADAAGAPTGMRVAVAGLGRMGTAIAERLLGAGHTVAVHNRTPGRAGALVAGGAQEILARGALYEHADTVITMVADSGALEDMALGEDGLALAPAAGGRTLIDMSTVSAEASARVAAAAREHGVRYLRAPVSGNPGVVRAGRLGIVVSGDERDFRAAEPLLRDIGPNVFYIGAGEAARVMKLALNLMVAGTAELLAEALVLAEAHGIDRERALDVIGGSAVASPFVAYKRGPLIERDYASTFTTALMRKDLDLAVDCGAAENVPLPATATVRERLGDCLAAGMGELDFMALLPQLQRDAGRAPDV